MMKKILLLVALAGVISQVKAQTDIFYETFETSTNSFPPGWTSEDLDGNGSFWVPTDEASTTDPLGFSGKVAVVVESAPDNLLGSPSITLPAGSINLTYQIGSFTGNGQAPFNCHYAVYVLPAATPYSAAAVPVLEETLSAGDIAFNKTVNLTSYAGQPVRVYFRNFDTGQLKALILDNVKITQSTLGISETNNDVQVGIYPNPATDFITAKTASDIISIEIYDMNGRKVGSQQKGNTVNIRSLQSGNYILNINTKQGKTSGKFIKK